jgi:lon-related putative ATP-dependent protease
MADEAAAAAGLKAEELRRSCDPAAFDFRTTDGLPDAPSLLGQERAIDAIRLSARIAHRGFNLFVIGPPGTGRRAAVENLLTEQAAERPVPPDWVYVNNFEAPHRPRALQLPPGTAQRLKLAMEALIDDLAVDIPAMFESEEYQTQRRAIEQEFGGRHETAFSEFVEHAKAQDVAVMRTPMGFGLAALRKGEVIKPEVYDRLPGKERDEIDAKIAKLQEELAEVLRAIPSLEREHRRRVEQLHAEMAERAVSVQIDEVLKAFSGIEVIEQFLADVREDMIANAELFLAARQEAGAGPFPEVVAKVHKQPPFDRYAVNVMVSHENGPDAGAPLEFEALPTLGNLTGRIEHESQMGALVTNFTLIKPGALHRANGGFLVLDARRLLTEPYAWDALKRCLEQRAISIISLAERLSLMSTTSLEPDPIDLDLRVVLIGDRLIHALLVMFDPDFGELFKVQADFSEEVERTPEAQALFARMIAGLARRENLKPLDASAVARLLDEAVRHAEDAERISLKIGALDDILREADYHAGETGRDIVSAGDIEKAVAEAERRASRLRERVQSMTERGTILIDTEGAALGQINGLSVIDLGNYRFGRPSRITARVRVGSGEVVDIEREVELGGPLHSKGVLILSGYLSSHYALDVPMSLKASLVFEQSYGGVDGDSASSAELYALLSALSGVPLRQDFAVTGSVNQAGHVQAIGGVNEKVEGFFDLCAARGLTGSQGVLIPRSNVKNLMLRPGVVEAVREGKFHVVPVDTIDQGIGILTGMPSGERGPDGAFPKKSLNARVEARLREFARLRHEFAVPDEAKGKKK